MSTNQWTPILLTAAGSRLPAEASSALQKYPQVVAKVFDGAVVFVGISRTDDISEEALTAKAKLALEELVGVPPLPYGAPQPDVRSSGPARVVSVSQKGVLALATAFWKELGAEEVKQGGLQLLAQVLNDPELKVPYLRLDPIMDAEARTRSFDRLATANKVADIMSHLEKREKMIYNHEQNLAAREKALAEREAAADRRWPPPTAVQPALTPPPFPGSQG